MLPLQSLGRTGIETTAIGFGWIGHLELGIVSDVIGVHWALAINGTLIIVVAAVALVVARSLKQA